MLMDGRTDGGTTQNIMPHPTSIKTMLLQIDDELLTVGQSTLKYAQKYMYSWLYIACKQNIHLIIWVSCHSQHKIRLGLQSVNPQMTVIKAPVNTLSQLFSCILNPSHFVTSLTITIMSAAHTQWLQITVHYSTNSTALVFILANN